MNAEILDYGFPQILELDVLKKYITQGGAKLEQFGAKDLRALTVQATGATSWRPEGIKYRKNEMYLDVIEFLNVQVSKQGQILNADVTGKVVVKCQLSGTPECKFGTNDKLVIPYGSGPDSRRISSQVIGAVGEVVLDDLKFHQCVRIGRQDQNKTITFIPPDGTFELLTYRATENIRLPFQVYPTIIERGRNRVEYSFKVKSTFPKSGVATNVIVCIPCPQTAARADIGTPSYGRARFEPTKASIFWRIKRFPGLTQATLRATVEMAASVHETQWIRPPVSLDFQVPMFTASGLRVRFLRVYEKSNYKTVKWIRYLTRAGHYQYRI